MNNDLKNILSNSNKDIDNQQLMDYLSNQLPRGEQHELEKKMAEDDFMNDAVEGLQTMNSPKDTQSYVTQLNNDLLKKIAKNKQHKNKRRWKDQPFTYIAIIILLLLIVICYMVMKNNLSNKPTGSERGFPVHLYAATAERE